MPKSITSLAAKLGVLMAVFGFMIGVGMKIGESMHWTTDTAHQQGAIRGENDGTCDWAGL